MLRFSQIKNSFWRVPLIALIAGFLYTPCYVQIVVRFGVMEPGIIDDRVTLLTSGGLLVVTLVLGWMILLKNLTCKEIFISSTIVVGYGFLVQAIQILSGSTTGSAAIVFMYLFRPLEWARFTSNLSFYLLNHFGFSIPLAGWISLCEPWLFVLFGKDFCRRNHLHA